jgi:hypothetical protein
MSQQPTFIVDLQIYTGTDFTQTFVLEDTQSNQLLNLTGYTACSHMRKYPTSSVAGTFNIDFAVDRSSGRIEIQMIKTSTINLKAGKYFYDIVLQDPDGKRVRPVEGTISVKRTITR